MIAEWRAGLSLSNKLPITFTENRLMKLDQLPVESILFRKALNKLMLELNSSIQSVGFYQMPVEYKGAYLQALRQQVEYALTMQGTAHVKIDTLMNRSMKSSFATTYGKGIAESVHLLTEYLSGTSVKVRLNPEWKQGMQATCRINVSSGVTWSVNYKVNLEVLQAHLLANRIPADWFGTIFSAMIIRHLALSVPGLIDPAIAVPAIQSILLQVAEVSGVDLRPAQIEALSLNVASVIEEDMAGGTGMIS